MSTSETFDLVKKLIGSSHVRKLESIDSPIAANEFKVVMKCGPTDFHLVREYSDGNWYYKCGDFPGFYVDDDYILSDTWYVEYELFGNIYRPYHNEYFGIYNDQPIYFAVTEGWDE